MNNKQIIQLINNGILTLTTHNLGPEQSYKVYKFKKTISSLFSEIKNTEESLLIELGIKNPEQFDARLSELKSKKSLTEEETQELNSKIETLLKFISVKEQFMNDEVDLSGLKKIPYEDWKILQDENKENLINNKKFDVLSGPIEELLENVLWIIPES